MGVLAVKIDRDLCKEGSEKEGEEAGLCGEGTREEGVVWEGRGRKTSKEVRGGTGGAGIGLEVGEGIKSERFDEAGRGEAEQSRRGEEGWSEETKGVDTLAPQSGEGADASQTSNTLIASSIEPKKYSNIERECA